MLIVKKFVLSLLLCAVSPLLSASDAEASKLYDEGFKAYQAQEYYKAAGIFEDVRILADSPTVKANSLRAQIGAWKMCNMPYREFLAIEALLSGYPDFADFKELTAREYELGTAYYNGLREPSYWHLRHIPWLNGGNKCIEIYSAVLKRAPFSPEAPGARLRLAHLYDDEGKIKNSQEQYRIIIRDFPESKAYPYALLALANGLLILAEQGDGDGRYVTEASDLLTAFRTKFPKAKELPWVERKLRECRNIQGKRNFDTACYYEQSGQIKTACRYLALVLQNYPDSASAAEAEKKLVKLDKSFLPGGFKENKSGTLPKLDMMKIPEEAPRILIVPRKTNHFLVPVPDLSNKQNSTQEKK